MVRTVRIAAGAVAIAAVGALGAGLAGCSVKVETAKAVSASALQKDLSDKLDQAGITVQSVSCNEDLPAEVGKTAGCDVDFSQTNDIQAVFTVTEVDGKDVSYEISPAMTQEQLQKAVAQITSSADVVCDSGVDGKVGASANCQVTSDDITTRRIAEVTEVDPSVLGLELSVVLLLDKQEVEDIVAQKVEAESGQPTDSVQCVEDVIAKTGTVVECAVVSGGETQSYDVTVTTIAGDTVNFDVVPQS